MSTKHTPKSCFRVAPSLRFKARQSAKPLLWFFFLFYTHANKTHFHKKGFALSLVLKVRVFGVRKQPRSQGLSSPTRSRRGPWERGWLENGPLSSMLEMFFHLWFFVHALQPKLWASSAKGEKRVWEFGSLSGYFLLFHPTQPSREGGNGGGGLTSSNPTLWELARKPQSDEYE